MHASNTLETVLRWNHKLYFKSFSWWKIIKNVKLYLVACSVALDLDVKLTAGHCADFSCDNRLDAEIGERSPQDSATEDDVLGCQLEILRWVGDLAEESEWIVLQNVDALMIRSEIVDLFLKHAWPELSA